jgi:hypothetical protein
VTYLFTAPQALSDIVAALRSAQPGVDVLDGPVVSGASLSEAITVGFEDGAAGIDAVSAQLARNQYTLDPLREQYTINCSVVVIGTTDQIGVCRARCFELLALVNDVLDDSATFSVQLASVQLGAYALSQMPGSKGIIVRLIFGIDIDAFTKLAP